MIKNVHSYGGSFVQTHRYWIIFSPYDAIDEMTNRRCFSYDLKSFS